MSDAVKGQTDILSEDEIIVEADQDPDSTEWDVERILAEGTGADGRVRYLVKWQGIPDHESTWETAEQFREPETIADWERQRDRGEILDGLQLETLLDKMEAFRKGQDTVSPTAEISQATPSDDDMDDQPLRKKVKTSQHVDGPLPLLKDKTVTDSSSKPRPRIETQPNSAPSTSIKRAASPAQTRVPPPGAKFRNLQHMGRACKKAAEERPVDPHDPALTTITFGPASPKQSSADQSPADDGSLFFPDNSTAKDVNMSDQQHERAPRPPSPASHSGEQVTMTAAPVMTKKFLTKVKTPSGPQTIAEATPPTPDHVSDLMANTAITRPVMPPAPGLALAYQTTTAMNGRIWKKNELVTHIMIGEHEIGPVKIVDLDSYARGVLLSFKKHIRSYEIRLEFAHEQVLNPPQLLEASSSWYDHAKASAPVDPFGDTAQACQGFSQHLEQHDSTAVWTHPDLDLILLLFAPKSSFWQQHHQYRGRANVPDLMVESRRRKTNLASAYPSFKSTVICKFWLRGPHHCRLGDSCMYAHPAQVSSEHTNHSPAAATMDELSTNKGAEGWFNQDHALQKDERPLPRRRMSEGASKATQPSKRDSELERGSAAASLSTRRRSFHDTSAKSGFDRSPSTDVVYNTTTKPGTALKTASIKADSQNGEVVGVIPHNAEPCRDTDWTFTHEFRKLLANIKNPKVHTSTNPFIVIALPEKFHEQINSLRNWAEKHTGTRSIFVLGKSAHQEWEEFKALTKSTVPNVLLFHEGHPTYTQLSDFSSLMFRHEIACHALSWNADADGKQASYHVSPLFPSNDLILITESAMISKPEMAAYVLGWFRSKKITGKLMVRPNVQDFLRDWALRCMESGKKQEADHILGLLTLCSEMSPAVDVTKPGSVARFEASLGGQHFVSQAGFTSFPELPDYDCAPTASVRKEEVAKRDALLLDYFANFTVAESGRFRRCLVLHDGEAGQTETTQHIVFRLIASFVQEQERKSKSTEAKS